MHFLSNLALLCLACASPTAARKHVKLREPLPATWKFAPRAPAPAQVDDMNRIKQAAARGPDLPAGGPPPSAAVPPPAQVPGGPGGIGNGLDRKDTAWDPTCPCRHRFPPPVPPPAAGNAPRQVDVDPRGDAFNFDVRSDRIVLMMDGLADVASRLAENRDPEFHKKDEDDIPFKCHCKCSLLGGCECWCGDKDKAPPK